MKTDNFKTLDQIMSAVCEHFKFEKNDLIRSVEGKWSKKGRIPMARRIFIYIGSENKFSNIGMGRYLNMSHRPIKHSLDFVEYHLDTMHDLRFALEETKKLLYDQHQTIKIKHDESFILEVEAEGYPTIRKIIGVGDLTWSEMHGSTLEIFQSDILEHIKS